MDLLLDTHVLLWWDQGAGLLGPTTRANIANPLNRIFVSAASIWEIGIKARKGKLSIVGSPAAAIGRNGFLPLPISPQHAEAAASLDWQHADPFDRMLVAQALGDNMTLVHANGVISAYRGLSQLWAC
ncbi:MAG TPA: type II toxin-antitoxin system VapC family toxin [Rhodospirillaceae bacterium]|nr:type II toxin-antitoxin system VapC family toxin [Rhodospirillaceae bacterium]